MAAGDNKRPDVKTAIINVMYMMALAMDRMMLDFERRMRKDHLEFRHDKKYQFRQIMDGIQRAYRAFQLLNDDIEHSCVSRGWDVLDCWYEESLELVRLLLLYDDRCGRNITNRDNLFKYLREMEGDGVITEDVLSRFYLKK